MPNTPATELAGVDIVEHLGGSLPRDAAFRDTAGNAVHLGDYFDGKRPTLLVFAYHTCPMLCSLVLDATVRSLNDVAWTVGHEFDVVSISIDPNDTPETATRKRGQVVSSYPRAGGATVGWHFLVGDETNIRKVTDAIGFEYRYDARQKQYAHPAAIYLLTPEGHIARYLYGIAVPAERRAPRPARGHRGPLGVHDRSHPPLLLPLRSAGQALLDCRHERDAPRRRGHAGRARHLPHHHVGARARPSARAAPPPPANRNSSSGDSLREPPNTSVV